MEKTALITGGSSGLGFYLAAEIRRRGYDVVLVSKTPEKLESAARQIGAVASYPLDLSMEYKKMKDIIEKHRPSVVINNAGFGIYGKFMDNDITKLERMLLLNVVALTWITKKALEVSPDAHVLNISSVAACHPLKKMAAYAATKAYVEHLTKSLRRENFKVSYLLLGPTRTSFFKNANMPTENIERIMLNPEKVAKYTISQMLKGKTRIVYGWIYRLYCLAK